jgi:hypothetical protein
LELSFLIVVKRNKKKIEMVDYIANDWAKMNGGISDTCIHLWKPATTSISSLIDLKLCAMNNNVSLGEFWLNGGATV